MEFINTRRQGDVGVAAATLYYAMKGFPVMMPLGEGQRYDLIVEAAATLIRVQCKTAFHKTEHGTYKAELRTRGGNQSGAGKRTLLSRDDADHVSVLDGDGNLWIFDMAELEGRSTVALHSDIRNHIVLQINEA